LKNDITGSEPISKLGIIAEICNSALRTGMDDITGFLSL
jgi:hypothetical protein